MLSLIELPAGYLVGTDWDAMGWDGIESEGICIMARHMGFKCHGMPHEIVYHEPPPQPKAARAKLKGKQRLARQHFAGRALPNLPFGGFG